MSEHAAKDLPPESDLAGSILEMPEVKGSITVAFPGGMQMVFNTSWTLEDFTEKYYEAMQDKAETMLIEIDKANSRIINLRQAMFVDYSPKIDMDALRKQ